MSRLIKIVSFNLLVMLNVSIAQMQFDWARRYNGPDYDSGNSVFVDDSGNVYVTGHVQAGPGFVCTTIKYNKFGDSLWVRNYQKPGSTYNLGFDMLVDDSGNVLVAATESVINYDRNGNLKWIKYDSANFSKIILDPNGNIYAGGFGYGRFVTAKYDRKGNQIWRNSSYTAAFKFSDMVLDKFSNIIITGQKEFANTFLDYTTIKYSNTGNIAWVRTYTGPAPPNSYDLAYGITADNSGNVYVTGASMNQQSYFECTTLKYDSLGNVIWIKRIPIASNIADSGHDILTDSSENVYIAAWLSGHTSTIKLDPDGNIVWYRVFPEGYALASNYPVMILDSVFNIYVTAISNPLYADYTAIKYDNDGNQIFVVEYSLSEGSVDYVNDMALGKNGSIYMTGVSNFSYVTVKFSPIITGVTGNCIQSFDYSLSQNYPNPFNPTTIIKYELPFDGNVSIKIYDITGRIISTLVSENKTSGRYEATFDGSNFASGIYYYKIESGNFSQVRKMILLK